MASQNDNNAAGAAMLIAVIVMVAYAVVLFIFLVAAFLAFVMTVMAIFAWERPLRLGSITIEPEEARAFVHRGLGGAVLLPVFGLFAAALLDWQIHEDAWFYLMIAGYTLGSVGIEYMMAKERERLGIVTPSAPVMSPAMPAPPPQKALPPGKPETFRYASWDDEELRG